MDSIPLDLYRNILLELPRKDLYVMAQTSKTWNREAKPVKRAYDIIDKYRPSFIHNSALDELNTHYYSLMKTQSITRYPQPIDVWLQRYGDIAWRFWSNKPAKIKFYIGELEFDLKPVKRDKLYELTFNRCILPILILQLQFTSMRFKCDDPEVKLFVDYGFIKDWETRRDVCMKRSSFKINDQRYINCVGTCIKV